MDLKFAEPEATGSGAGAASKADSRDHYATLGSKASSLLLVFAFFCSILFFLVLFWIL